MNGQLPNLDLFNVMDKLTRSNDGNVFIHGRRDPPTRDLIENCLQMLQTSLLGMWQQASGRPISGHALFLPYHIDALSIKCQPQPQIEPSRRRVPNMGYANMAKTIEGTVRSINNLLERFHQSFFYYVMPSTNNYISIGLYIPALALCLLSSAVKALDLWFRSLITLHVFEQPEIPSLKVIPDITSVFRVLFASFLLPSSVYFAVPWLNELKVMNVISEDIDNAEFLLFTFLGTFLILVTIPLYMPSIYCQETLTMNQRDVYKSIAIFLTIVGIGANCVANFSLTYFVAILSVPMMNLTTPTKCKYLRLMQKVICLVFSPLTVVMIMPIVSFHYNYSEEPINVDVCVTQIKSMVMKVVHESYVHNSSLLWQMWILFIPLWLVHWFLLWVPALAEENKVPSSSDEDKSNCSENSGNVTDSETDNVHNVNEANEMQKD